MPFVTETFYSDFKEFAGVRYPTVWASRTNGKDVGAMRLTEVRPVLRLDDAMFDVP